MKSSASAAHEKLSRKLFPAMARILLDFAGATHADMWSVNNNKLCIWWTREYAVASFPLKSGANIARAARNPDGIRTPRMKNITSIDEPDNAMPPRVYDLPGVIIDANTNANHQERNKEHA